MAISKITLNGVTQMDVTQKTVTENTMLNGVTSLKNDGTDITGNIQSKTSSDLTVNGATVTAPAGYYGSAASKSVASGTAGTPTATKGAVSNHSVTVTPSVTNTTGYIPGGTKTGPGTSVAASELVSGSNTLLMNGTFDVTNLASIITSFPNGFDCEYGEFTPATDEVTHNISFTKTHYGLPFIAMVIDKDGYDSSADTNHTMVYFNWQDIFSNGVYSTSSSVMMGEVLARYRTTSLVTKNYTLWYSEANSSNASTYYPRYWVTETGMKAEVGSTSYWRASRTYKWFAAWKPTVMPPWERGSINTSTGSTEASQNRISTSSFIHVRQIGNYFQVYVPSGARIYVTGYTSNHTFVPMTSAWQTGTVYINTTISGYSTVEYIKITASYTDDSAISDVQTLAKDIIIRGVE